MITEQSLDQIFTATERLIAARLRITPSERWTTGAFARDHAGFAIAVESADAISWCGFGSLVIEMQNDDPAIRTLAMDILLVPLVHRYDEFMFTDFNDRSDHRAVLTYFDEQIGETITLLRQHEAADSFFLARIDTLASDYQKEISQ